MNIQIGFSTRKNNWVSTIIRKITGSPVSHVWLRFRHPIFDTDMVLEADVSGFLERPYAKFCEKNQIVRVFRPKDQEALARGLRASIDMIGDSYDFWGLLGMLPVIVANWFGKKIMNPLDSPHALFCSEAICRILENGAYEGISEIPSRAKPSMLYEFFLEEEASA